jgi:hypothetical protein
MAGLGNRTDSVLSSPSYKATSAIMGGEYPYNLISSPPPSKAS